MVPTNMNGLLVHLALAFGIAARARPMENLAGYGEKSANLAESGQEALEHFNHVLSAEEAAWFPTTTRQHHDQTLSGARRLASDPLSHLAGYASGETGASASSSYSQASFGGHYRDAADAGGLQPNYPPFQQGQAGFHDGNAAFPYLNYPPAGHQPLNHHQLADPNLAVEAQPMWNPPTLQEARPSTASPPAPVQRRVRSRSDRSTRHTAGSSKPSDTAAASKHSTSKQRISTATSQPEPNSLKHRATLAANILSLSASNSIPDITPTNAREPILPTLTRLEMRMLPADRKPMVRLTDTSARPTSLARALVLDRFVRLGEQSFGYPIEAHWIDRDKRPWPHLDPKLSTELEHYFATHPAADEITSTIQQFMRRKGQVPKACFQIYILDGHLVIMRKLETVEPVPIHDGQEFDIDKGPFFYNVVAVPMGYFRTEVAKGAGLDGAGSGTKRRNNAEHVYYNFGVLMTNVDSRVVAS